MAKINNLLTQRLKSATDKLTKMTSLAELSSGGNLSSFSGVFRVSQLSIDEKEKLQTLLKNFKNDGQEIDDDFKHLSSLTSEVKAITNQAAILHGERIKKAQDILKKYRDGAFTAWLLETYGNRQTPYNFLQYYELHRQLPQNLLPKLDEMPRQAIYTLASRAATLEEKQNIIENYKGQSKTEILQVIRTAFPLSEQDKRREDLAERLLQTLEQASQIAQDERCTPSVKQKERLRSLVKGLAQHV